MAIYRFSAAPLEGIIIPPKSPVTITETFRLLAAHDVGATLLEYEAEYPLDITPPHSDNRQYLLTLTSEDSARLDIKSTGDSRSIIIPYNKSLVPIISENAQCEQRLYEVIAVLPLGITGLINY